MFGWLNKGQDMALVAEALERENEDLREEVERLRRALGAVTQRANEALNGMEGGYPWKAK